MWLICEILVFVEPRNLCKEENNLHWVEQGLNVLFVEFSVVSQGWVPEILYPVRLRAVNGF